jgi:ABC-type transport system involved in multi-copper enzyme maturation permease subunit
MTYIVKTEWLKIKNYPAFWWVFGITALTYPGINYLFLYVYHDIVSQKSTAGQVLKALMGNPFSLPEGWRTMAFFSSFFIYIPSIVVIMLITNEYTYRTNRQNIIDGWSRKNFMAAKMIDVLLLSAIVTVLYAVVAMLIGVSNTDIGAAGKWNLSYYIGLFFLQTFSQLSIAFTVGMLLRKAFIALAVFTFYSMIVEEFAVNILKYKYNNNIGRFFPMEISDRLLTRPLFLGKIDEAAYRQSIDAVKYHVVYAIVLLILTWLFCFWVNNRRDL